MHTLLLAINLKSMFHCLLRHYSKAKIFGSAGGAHPLLHSPHFCVVVIYLPGYPLFKIAGSAPVAALWGQLQCHIILYIIANLLADEFFELVTLYQI